MRDHLGDHRVVEGRDAVPGLEARVDAHGRVAGAEAHLEDAAGRGQEIVLRILRVDARLDRRAAPDDVLLPERQGLARGHPELPLDEVEAGHRLRDGMLDLEPRVHLEEVEVPQGPGRVGDELDRSRPLVARGERRVGRRLRHGRAGLLRQAGRRALLDHLLVAPLQRAVALEQVDAVPMAVGEHLHLDVARRGHVLLDQHPSVAEGALGLAARALESRLELDVGVDPAHAPPASARDRLDEDGIADLVGLLAQELRALVVAVVARDDGHPRPLHERLGRVLEPHRSHRIGRRADERHARPPAGFREVRVFRQEPVARMQAFGADPQGEVDDCRAVEVAARAVADLVGLVGQPREERAAIRRRMQDDGHDSHTAGGADDPAGDFAAIGDQDVRKHEGLPVEPVYRTRAEMASGRRNGAWSNVEATKTIPKAPSNRCGESPLG